MNQLRQLFHSLTLRQKISIAMAVMITGVALLALSAWRKDRDYRVLCSRLSPEDTAAVAQKLKEAQVDFRPGEDGTSILVPSSALASGRLALASAGLPKSGRIGFELFDKTNLTATDFAEHVNFARALEGELERSILLIDEVERARVHITFPKESVFVESREPAKASVMVGMRSGRTLSPANVNAITQLVASAVQGLAPESVAVVDVRGQLLGRPRRGNGMEEAGLGDAFTDYRIAIERDLQSKLNLALEPVLGDGKFRTGVSVECDYASREESEEAVDPDRTIMLSQQRTEEATGSAQSAGVPGTASNLPRPTSRPAASSGGVSRRTENATYQPTRSVKLVKTPRGQVKRISVAILVDHEVQWKGSGAKREMLLVPPAPEKLKVIRETASSILGLQPDRGDQITVESLPFDSTVGLLQHPPEGQVKGDSSIPAFLRPWLKSKQDATELLMQGAALLIIVLACVVGIVLWRESRRGQRTGASVRTAPALPAASGNPGAALPDASAGATHPLQVQAGTGSAQLADLIRQEIRKDPRAIALAIRHMLAESE
jgi:flagellar M-ring protein FliF